MVSPYCLNISRMNVHVADGRNKNPIMGHDAGSGKGSFRREQKRMQEIPTWWYWEALMPFIQTEMTAALGAHMDVYTIREGDRVALNH
jgi:hypothetical protein